MRLTILMLITIILQVSASNTYSQDQRINVDVKNQSVRSVLKEIESKSDFTFVYSGKAVDLDNKVSLKVTNEKISDVLKQILVNYDYSVKGRMIVIVPASQKETQQQQKSPKITGVVKDEKGEPLTGVTIKLRNVNLGTITDIDGKYTLINVPVGDQTIDVSYVGYNKKSVKISGLKAGDEKAINVVLNEGVELNEVTVTALGIKKQDKALGYSVSKLDGEDLNNTVSNNWLNGMAGKVAGLNFDVASAGPGGSIRVTLRGEGSLSHDKNTALFVIDGVPISSETTPSTTGGGYDSGDEPVDFGGGAGDINPEDIESVSVLKGPAATALYGSRAANGAIVITTKSGNNVKGLGITVNSMVTVEQADYWPAFQTDYAAGQYSKENNGDAFGGNAMPREFSWWSINGVTRENSIFNYGEKIEPGKMRYIYDSRNWQTGEYTKKQLVSEDWYKGFFETGVTYNNSITLDYNSGKGNVSRLSFKDTRNEWIVPNTGYNQQNLSLSLTQKVNKTITFGTKVTYLRKNSDNMPVSGYSASTPLYHLMRVSPAISVAAVKNEYFSGRLMEIYNRPGYVIGSATADITSPYADNLYFQVYEEPNTISRNRVFGNANVTINIIPDKLILTGRTGMDWNADYRTQKKPYYSHRALYGMYREQNINTFEMNNDWLLTYKDKFGDFNVNATLGGNAMNRRYQNVTMTAPKLFTYNVFQLQNSDGQILSSINRTVKSVNGLYGVFSTDWKSTLFLEVTGRNDWSSTLPVENNSYFYPSVNTSILLDRIFDFRSNAPWIDLMKLRGSWANVGNDTDPYQLYQVYANSDFVSAYKQSGKVLNPHLKPENVESWEFGYDMRLFRNRASIDVTYYAAATTDQIIDVPSDWSTGYSSTVINAGKVTNKGVEVAAHFQLLKNKKWNWSVNLTWNKNWNKLVELAPGRELWQLNAKNTIGSRVMTYAYPGTELGRIYGRGYERAPEGAFYTEVKSDGSVEVVPCAGQVVVDAKTGYPVLSEDLKDYGSIYPDWKAGMTQTLSYRGFTLNMTFAAQWGGTAYTLTHQALSYYGKTKNTLEGRYAGLIVDGVNLSADGIYAKNNKITNDIVTYYAYYVYQRDNVETNIFKTTYLKMKELRLDYKIPAKKLRLIGLQTATIGVYATNLFCITDWPQFDPEVASFGDGSLNRGIEVGGYPMTRTYGANLKFTF